MSAILQIDPQRLTIRGDWTVSQVVSQWPLLAECKAATLDLSKLKRIDSAGIAAIITALKPEPSHPLKIEHCPEQAKQLFELYELNPLLQFEK
ncbi:STAS domain-containing protein [Agarivorans sp. QJM3NY_33]|uniref:STAS domain-containing protein n=1 Tax=Agarivorans sp. QJM3NY_33 TaxID=3421432 RepID=UPI003D7D2E67